MQGLLNGGASKSKIAKDLKISRNSVIAIEHRMRAEGLHNPARVEAIKRTFRGKATLVLNDALRAVTTRKLRASSAADCMKVADRAAQLAGLAETPFARGAQLNVLQQFFGLQSGLRSISSVDALPKEQEHEASEA